MRFHSERDKRLHPLRHSAFDPPRPIHGFPRSKLVWYDDVIADDSVMLTACYEAHLCMQKMLAVFAELRGDET